MKNALLLIEERVQSFRIAPTDSIYSLIFLIIYPNPKVHITNSLVQFLDARSQHSGIESDFSNQQSLLFLQRLV